MEQPASIDEAPPGCPGTRGPEDEWDSALAFSTLTMCVERRRGLPEPRGPYHRLRGGREGRSLPPPLTHAHGANQLLLHLLYRLSFRVMIPREEKTSPREGRQHPDAGSRCWRERAACAGRTAGVNSGLPAPSLNSHATLCLIPTQEVPACT